MEDSDEGLNVKYLAFLVLRVTNIGIAQLCHNITCFVYSICLVYVKCVYYDAFTVCTLHHIQFYGVYLLVKGSNCGLTVVCVLVVLV